MTTRGTPSYLLALVSATTLFTLAAAPAKAQIVWDPVQSISGNTSDFSLLGSYVDAASVNGGTVTVYNGSTPVGTEVFNSLRFTTGAATDGADISFSDVASNAGGDGYDPTGTSPNNLQDNYAAALDGVVYDGNDTGSTGGTVNLGGLTIGDTYQVEVFKGAGFRTTIYTSGANTAHLDGSDYVIGSFTATTNSFSFGFAPDTTDGGTDGEVSGVALRDITGAVVPEPSTYALMLGGLAFLLGVRRLKRA